MRAEICTLDIANNNAGLMHAAFSPYYPLGPCVDMDPTAPSAQQFS